MKLWIGRSGKIPDNPYCINIRSIPLPCQGLNTPWIKQRPIMRQSRIPAFSIVHTNSFPKPVVLNWTCQGAVALAPLLLSETGLWASVSSRHNRAEMNCMMLYWQACHFSWSASWFSSDMPFENGGMWGSSTWWEQWLSPNCHCQGMNLPHKPSFSGSISKPDREELQMSLWHVYLYTVCLLKT